MTTVKLSDKIIQLGLGIVQLFQVT